MKKSYALAFLFLLVTAISGIVLLAQDRQGNEWDLNNPSANPDANACYAGGSLEGLCQAEWQWVCGWGIIRVEYNILARDVLSQTCQSLMPALVVTTTPGQSNSEPAASAESTLASPLATTTPLPGVPTNTPTNTQVPPTETLTNTPTETSTDTPTETPTNTPTPTETPTATNTPV